MTPAGEPETLVERTARALEPAIWGVVDLGLSLDAYQQALKYQSLH